VLPYPASPLLFPLRHPWTPWLTGFPANLEHPVVRTWAETLMAERQALWASRGRGEDERRGLAGFTVGCVTDEKTGKDIGAGGEAENEQQR
jgi:hypothetical protein